MGIDPISIGLMAGGMLLQGFGAMKGAAAAKRQERAQAAQADLQAQNQRLEQVRQSRIAKAKVLQMGANQGAGESSSVTSAANNATGQGNANIDYINQQQGTAQNIRTAQGQINDAQGISAIGGAITNLGGTAFSNDTYLTGKVKSIFG